MRIHIDTNSREGCPRLHVSPGHISTSSKRIICRPPMLQDFDVFMRVPHTYMIIYYSYIIIYHHKSYYHYLSSYFSAYICTHVYMSLCLIVSSYIRYPLAHEPWHQGLWLWRGPWTQPLSEMFKRYSCGTMDA